jgi:putative protease
MGSGAGRQLPELLAPAGHVEGFMAAVENGADAVYLGLKRLSARASAVNFSLDDLAVLLPYAHKRGRSVYVALNSLVTASEISSVLNLLQSLSDLKVDALIIQDPGIFFLARKYFPHLKLHASTLAGIHNHPGVNQLQRMGFKRVVLARELDFKEIKAISENTTCEIEMFVHGALCFSYSGFCLASSFRGGHSGLQGRCVQPCRLRLRQGRNEGYFLSCNDISYLRMIPELKKLRLAALKIEGRMKSADYIAQVVRAYRLVIDAAEKSEREAVEEACGMLANAPSRHLTSGYLGSNIDTEILAPHRSGSSGVWVGTVTEVRGGRAVVALRHELRPGDRLRPESAEGKERGALTVSEMSTLDGRWIACGRAGEDVLLPGSGDLQPRERLFKIGGKTASSAETWGKIRKEKIEVISYSRSFPHSGGLLKELPAAPADARETEETLIVKIGSAGDFLQACQSEAQRIMLAATRRNLERLAKQRLIPAQKARLIWSLPALIAEKETRYYKAAVEWYLEKGFLSWEVNNWGHLDFFSNRERANLISGHRFNIRNSAAMAALYEAGCGWSVLSLEITKNELEFLARSPSGTAPVVTIYAWPPLFISRLAPKLKEEKPVLTGRNEVLLYRRRQGRSCIYADRPMDWCGQLPLLRNLGFHRFLFDLSDGPENPMGEFGRLLKGYRHAKAHGPFSLFNFDRRPL